MKKLDAYAKRSAARDFGINIVAVDENGKSLGLKLDAARDGGTREIKPKTGKRVTSSRPLPEDSKIQLKMLFPERSDLNLLKAHGTIKWVKQVKEPAGKYFLIGVHFREASVKDKLRITKLWKTHRTP
jgi:hypothetical protein